MWYYISVRNVWQILCVTMEVNVMYEKLLKEAKFAKASRSLLLMYQTYGAAQTAEELGAITREQFWTLNDMLVKDGINNPASYDKLIH